VKSTTFVETLLRFASCNWALRNGVLLMMAPVQLDDGAATELNVDAFTLALLRLAPDRLALVKLVELMMALARLAPCIWAPAMLVAL